MTDEQLLTSFRRDTESSWTCIKPVLFDGTARNIAIMPGSVITKADLFCGVDVARELELAEARQDKQDELKMPRHL